MKAMVFRFFVILLVLIFAFSINISADGKPNADPAGTFALYDINEGTFIMSKNLDAPICPASTAKIMSGLIVCEKLASRANNNITLTAEMLYCVSGKNMQLMSGQTLKIKDLMFAAYGCGYNDAATALAVIAAGSTENMVALMNARAAELKMYATKYTNVTGMDSSEMRTTVRDTVTLAKAAAENALFLEVSSVYNYNVKFADGYERIAYGSNEIINRNNIYYYCSSAKGLNSGATDGGGACIVTYGEYKGKGYIVAAMGCSEENDSRFALVQDALDWAYKSAYSVAAKEGDIVGEIKVTMGPTETDAVSLVLKEDLFAVIDSSYDSSLIHYGLIIHDNELEAPLKEGDVVGKYVLWCGDEVLGTADVTVSETVEKSTFLSFLNGVKEYITGRAFIVTVICLLLISCGVLIYPKLALRSRQRKRKYVNKRGGFDLKK